MSLAREGAFGAQIVLASAEQLPCPNASFTAMAMSIVFFFLPDPLAALCEAHGVLARGGRIAIYTTRPHYAAPRAGPEPLASRSHFHEKDERVALADPASFDNTAVSDRSAPMLVYQGSGRD